MHTTSMTWAILTGEYPPDHGGVSDYTRLVAEALAREGDDVHVVAPPARHPGASVVIEGVTVHRISDSFGLRGLLETSAILDRLPTDTRLLVQFVPHAFGYKAMNVALCAWLASQRRRAIDVMFHEVATPLVAGQRIRHSILGIVHQLMAALVVFAADRIFISTESWTPALRRFTRRPIRVAPVPSNLPCVAQPAAVERIRCQLAPQDSTLLLGHFGTSSPLIVPMLHECLVQTLAADRRVHWLLTGRGWEALAVKFHDRVSTALDLEAPVAANHMAACDILVQPYPDGVTTRRSSFIAGMALGVASVTNRGDGTESLWDQTDGVVLTACSSQALIEATIGLMNDPQRRRDIGQRGREFYRQHFDLCHTVHQLRETVV